MEWVKVPSHLGLYGTEMADKLADLGVQKHGVRIQGQEQPTPKRQAEWARDRGDQEQASGARHNLWCVSVLPNALIWADELHRRMYASAALGPFAYL